MRSIFSYFYNRVKISFNLECMKRILVLLLLLLIVSCGATKVNYDYDKETDFSDYTTYNYFSDINTGLSDLDTKRLLNALEITLKNKGLLLSEEPDFLVDIKSTSYQTARNNSVGLGLGGGGRNVGGGVSVGIPVGQAKLERQVTFDFVDTKRDVLFWQASSTSSFKENTTPELREQKLQELVNTVFEKYPPEK